MADNQNLADGFGNGVVFNETGMEIVAAPGKNLNLVTSDGGELTANGEPITGGGVTSFNSRTGAVVPESGDYSYSEISGTPVFADAEVPTTFTTNAEYILAHTPNPLASLQVFIDDTSLGTDGCNKLLVQGTDYHLGGTGNTHIIYDVTPTATNKIVCWYRH
jgi:hypothetical protein